MPATFFSGTKAGTGGALFVTFNSKEQSTFFRVIKQTGWDDKISKPTFSGGESIYVKFSTDEIGEMIHAVSGHDSAKFYHDFKGEVTSGGLNYYEKEFTNKAGKQTKSRGFGLTIKKGAFEVKLGLSLGAAERLSQYLQFALDHMHSAIYQQDKKDFEEYLKKKDGGNSLKNSKQTITKVKEAVRDALPEVLSDDVENPPELVDDGNDQIPF